MSTSSFPSNQDENDVTSDQVQSWTAKNASLAREQEYDLISVTLDICFEKKNTN